MLRVNVQRRVRFGTSGVSYNYIVGPMKTILLSLCCMLFPLAVVHSSEPKYTVQQINGLIEAGKAKRSGACFANQGLGCQSYLWKESNNHHVFFFLRDGTCYGEYRDEVLSGSRFLSTAERYLVNDSRKSEFLANTKVLPFVCKSNSRIWKDDACIESRIRWTFVSTDLKGKEVERGATVEQGIRHGVISIIVPSHLASNDDEFLIGLTRESLTEHETAFGARNPVIEHFGLTNLRSSIWVQMPDANARFVVTLFKKLPDPEVGTVAFPGMRRQRLASMTISLDSPRNTPFVFVPDDASP